MVFITVLALLCAAGVAAQDNSSVTFFMALKQNPKGVQTLERYLLDHASNPTSQKYGQYLDQNDIAMLTAASDQHVSQVNLWLKNVSATNVKFYGDSYCVTLTGKQYAKQFTEGKKKVIPKGLVGAVVFIEPLVNQQPKNFKKKFKDQSFPLKTNYTDDVDNGYITREVLMKLYNIDGGVVHKNRTSVGAMEFDGGEGFSQDDMVLAQVASLVRKNPVSQDHILGQNADPDGESELDMAVIWMAAADVDLWYSDFQGWIFGWAASFFNRKDIPQVASISWGWSEKKQCSIGPVCGDGQDEAYVERTNVELMKLTARGLTIVVSSGDAGSPGRTNEPCYGIEQFDHISAVFPGGSPWVLSVGGTYVKKSSNDGKSPRANWTSPICKILPCVNGTTEAVTTYAQTGWTSGAGFTHWDETPKWQRTHVAKYVSSDAVVFPDKTYWNPNGRGYPDLVTFGHLCAMVSSGQFQSGDGTSCSAPIMAGIIAYLNDHQKSNGKPVLGYVNPLLYKMYEEHPVAFNDISEGNSACTEFTCCSDQFGFKPVKGMWDVVSGLGSPNVAEMKRYLNKL